MVFQYLADTNPIDTRSSFTSDHNVSGFQLIAWTECKSVGLSSAIDRTVIQCWKQTVEFATG